MSYNIGSLNIRKSLRTEDQNRDFHTFMHGFIRDAKLDIVAFQEIGRKDAMESVLNSLSAKWTGWKGSHSYGSEFAFIWNSNRVSECSKSHTPQIYQNYRSDYRMMRDPYYGRFAPNDLELNTEFRLVNVHLVHGGSDSLAAIGERKLECGLSKGVIHQTLDVHRYGNFKRSFTIVLGDYNLDCETCNQIGLDRVKTVQTEKTTVKNKEDDYSRNYDHFSYDAVKNESVECEAYRFDAVSTYFKGSFEAYRYNVSDHVPIVFKIGKSD